MRWTPGGMSRNVEDRRGTSGGGGGGFRMGGGGGMGLGGLAIMVVLSLIFGRDMFSGGGEGAAPSQAGAEAGGPVQQSAEEGKLAQFVSFVLDDAQAVWTRKLPEAFNTPYREARLVLFRGGVQSGCGSADAAMGPFYCPTDEKAYIDLGFYEDLQRRFGAPGDFAQAYVLAHEIGHHVQNVLGTSSRVRALQERRPNDANGLSVRIELQADCFAGIWAASTNERRLLEQGDVEEGLGAAAAVGDDRLQRQGGAGRVNPESFTHGTSAQRQAWFQRGLQSGDPRNCDTFAGGI